MRKQKYTFQEALELTKNRMLAFLPWSITYGLGVNLIVLLISGRHLSLPGASTALFWTAVLSVGVAMVACSPLVIRRLEGEQKKFVWAGSLVAFFIAAGSSGNLQQAYESTPAGAFAKKEREIEENNRIIAERQQEYAAKIEENNQIIAERQQEYTAKLEACFGTFNSDEMPELTDAVKERLHNPEAFEHIETKIALTEIGTTNVRMRFRGENGFSAIRTASVNAQINPDDCSVIFVGKPEIEN